jgi:hypothetical protein
MRKTNVADARKMGLLPSVTEVIRLLAKEGLVKWQIETALSGVDPRDEASKAASMGSVIHNLIEIHLAPLEVDDLGKDPIKAHLTEEEEERVNLIMEKVYPILEADFEKGMAEKVVVGEKTAGMIDWHGYYKNALTINDFKTQKTKEGKCVFYDEWLYQLCGYRKATGDRSQLMNTIISTTEPGVIKTKIWSDEDIERGTKVFSLLEDLFYTIKKL